jgi:hypothetical protein
VLQLNICSTLFCPFGRGHRTVLQAPNSEIYEVNECPNFPPSLNKLGHSLTSYILRSSYAVTYVRLCRPVWHMSSAYYVGPVNHTCGLKAIRVVISSMGRVLTQCGSIGITALLAFARFERLCRLPGVHAGPAVSARARRSSGICPCTGYCTCNHSPFATEHITGLVKQQLHHTDQVHV